MNETKNSKKRFKTLNRNGAKHNTNGSVVEIRPCHPPVDLVGESEYDMPLEVWIHIHNLVNGKRYSYKIDLENEKVVEKRWRKNQHTMKKTRNITSTPKLKEIVKKEWDVEL